MCEFRNLDPAAKLYVFEDDSLPSNHDVYQSIRKQLVSRHSYCVKSALEVSMFDRFTLLKMKDPSIRTCIIDETRSALPRLMSSQKFLFRLNLRQRIGQTP